MIDSWEAYNDFLMHGALDRFTKVFARYELFKNIIDIPGDIVECGVLRGTGVLFWAKLISIFNPLSPRKVIGFDTFEGYLESGGEIIVSSSPASIMCTAWELGIDKRIELIKGDACETIPQYIKENAGFRVALLNLDFDVCKPTKVALKHLYPLIVPDGIVVIDEYAKPRYDESSAVDDFIKGKDICLKSFPWALSPTAYFQKGVKLNQKS